MAHLNYKFQALGGLNTFLNDLILNDAFKPMTTEEFVAKISSFYKEDLMPLFKAHTYSSSGIETAPQTSLSHMKMSIQEMRSLL